MTLLMWLLSNKLLVFLITATTAFCISTIVLGVDNTDLNDELKRCKLTTLASTTPSTATTTVPTAATTTTEEPATEPPSNDDDMSKYRLPSGVAPSTYDLYLYPNLEEGTFTGRVAVSLDVAEDRPSVVLHGNKLTVTGAAVDGEAGTFAVDEEHELLEVFAKGNATIARGERVLEVEFRGDMTNRIVGLYKSTYTNEEGQSRYDITLEPNLRTGAFSGRVNITFAIGSPRRDLLLHSKNLSVDTVELVYANGSEVVQVLNVEDDAADEMIRVVTREELRGGVYFVVLKYGGTMLNRIRGLYMSKYKNEANESRAIATSKFEPTYARQAFPCFDEPNMKAKYKVHLLKPADSKYIALSNMPEESSEPQGDDNVLVHFAESVKMSTYLVCFIVSDFQYTEDYILPDSDNITFRVYATPAQLEKTNYAREIGKKVIEYYIDYFGIKFPLPKLDMAAIPDFVSGAMEHWGLVTYRETALLYTNTTHSSANKQRVATVVAHELAHSWFGNLVTMNWWNDLWLNEGFASYIEYKGVDFCEPDWQMLDQFLVAELHPVFKLDAKLSSHPIVQTVTTPDEITAIFDTISYNKGASILRMLEDAVGNEVFQKAVTNYLKAHEYGNAVTQDLLDEIQTIYGDSLNVTEFMSTWTMQMGFPVVTVAVSDDNYVLTQTQYLTDPESTTVKESSPYDYKWTIPITYITDSSSAPVYNWFKHSDESITIPKPAGAKWVKFNYGQTGYYRVNYEASVWEELISHYSEFTIADKTHLLEETFRLAESGHLNYRIPLSLVQNLKEETNYVPWSVASTMVEQIREYLTASKYLTNFQDYVKDIVSKAYETLTWTEGDEDSHLKRRARLVVLDLACSVGHEDCLKEASAKFTEWLDATDAELSQDLRTLVYNYGMSAGTSEQWYKLWDKFVAESDANEKLKLLSGLASVKDTVLLKRLLVLAEDETYIRSQDYFTCVKYIAANPIGEPIVWDYVRENWEVLVARFGLNDRYLGQLIPSITSAFSSTTKLEEMKAFFEKYPEAGAGASYRATALETVSNNIKWLSKYKEDVEEVVKDYKSS